MGSLVSGLLGGGESGGQKAQMQALAGAQQAYQDYRPEAMQARLNRLSNASTAYQGMNNALETMYGGHGPKGPNQLSMGNLRAAPRSPMGEQPRGRFAHPGAAMPQSEGQAVSGQHSPGQSAVSPVGQVLDPLGVFKGIF